MPDKNEDPRAWEEALSKKPSDGSIPVLAKGFFAIGQRLEVQVHAVRHLQQRLHEINNSLDQIIQKHDLEFATRVSEARRRHLALCQRTLAVATKVQTLRNRGYSLDPIEEELKKRLTAFERTAFDPAITGRQDEIWARMAGLRSRAQMIKEEMARRGANSVETGRPPLNEEATKEITKVCFCPSNCYSFLRGYVLTTTFLFFSNSFFTTTKSSWDISRTNSRRSTRATKTGKRRPIRRRRERCRFLNVFACRMFRFFAQFHCHPSSVCFWVVFFLCRFPNHSL